MCQTVHRSSIHVDDECRPEFEAKETPENPDEDASNTIDTGVGLGRKRGCGQGTTQPKHSFSIASLNVKNFKTNQNFIKDLSSSHKILVLQEHWLYGFETAILGKIYDHSNYHVKCVDDANPILPVQPSKDMPAHA